MTRITALSLLLSFGSVAALPAMAQETEASSELSVRQKVGLNLKAEALALRDLARAIRADVDAGTLSLTPEAKGMWKEGEALWDQLLDEVESEKYKAAYTTVREARRLMGTAMKTAFDSGTPSAKVRKALKAYVGSVEPRIDAVKAYREANGLEGDAAASWDKARSVWKKAKASLREDKHGMAMGQALDALSHLDQVIRHVYEAKQGK